jgi:hypothetical protein
MTAVAFLLLPIEATPDLAANAASREIEAPWAITEAMPALAIGDSPAAARKWRTTAVSAETTTPATHADFRRAEDPASTAATVADASKADTPVATVVVAATVVAVDTAAADTATAEAVTNANHLVAKHQSPAHQSGAFF